MTRVIVQDTGTRATIDSIGLIKVVRGSVIGMPGPIGPQGIQGATGPSGPTGPGGGSSFWQSAVKGVQSSPPTSPATGDRYIVASVASGSWAWNECDIATYTGSSWEFVSPEPGWRVWDEAEEEYRYFNGDDWFLDHREVLTIEIGNGSSVISTGLVKKFYYIASYYSIVDWVLFCDPSASVYLAVLLGNYPNVPTTNDVLFDEVLTSASTRNRVTGLQDMYLAPGNILGVEVVENDNAKFIQLHLVMHRAKKEIWT